MVILVFNDNNNNIDYRNFFSFIILEKLKMSKNDEEKKIHQNLSKLYERDLSVNWEEDEHGIERIVELSLFSLNIYRMRYSILKN